MNFATQTTALAAVNAPSILIRRWNDPYDEIYATTAHELGHFAHWKLNNATFIYLIHEAYLRSRENEERVIESWGEGIEWQFATHRYRNILRQTNYNYLRNLQNRTINGVPIRTSLVVDMIDNFNQRQNGPDLPRDRVENYTIREIEDGLDGAIDWEDWRDNMVERFNDPHGTEQFIDELFNNW